MEKIANLITKKIIDLQDKDIHELEDELKTLNSLNDIVELEIIFKKSELINYIENHIKNFASIGGMGQYTVDKFKKEILEKFTLK